MMQYHSDDNSHEHCRKKEKYKNPSKNTLKENMRSVLKFPFFSYTLAKWQSYKVQVNYGNL